jgi:hypothetical protein
LVKIRWYLSLLDISDNGRKENAAAIVVYA